MLTMPAGVCVPLPALVCMRIRVPYPAQEAIRTTSIPWLPAVGIIMTLWSTVYIESWQRRQAKWASMWGTSSGYSTPRGCRARRFLCPGAHCPPLVVTPRPLVSIALGLDATVGFALFPPSPPPFHLPVELDLMAPRL